MKSEDKKLAEEIIEVLKSIDLPYHKDIYIEITGKITVKIIEQFIDSRKR